MSGISQVLEVARRAILAQQYQMNVVGHNIANASTPGYSRQRAHLVATAPTESGSGGLLGTGVIVDSVDRLRNRFRQAWPVQRWCGRIHGDPPSKVGRSANSSMSAPNHATAASRSSGATAVRSRDP